MFLRVGPRLVCVVYTHKDTDTHTLADDWISSFSCFSTKQQLVAVTYKKSNSKVPINIRKRTVGYQK